MNRDNGRARGGRGRGVSGLAHDLAEMAELQWHLFQADLRDGKHRAPVPVGLLALGVWLVLATVPLLLFALAWSLIEFAEMHATWAYLIAAAAGLLLGGGLLVGAYIGFRRMLGPFQRSREEFARNFDWFKRALRPGSGPQPDEQAALRGRGRPR